VDLGEGSFVLVATDGLFSDAAPSPEALVRHVTSVVDEGADAEALVADALAGGSDDNVTVLLWRPEET
jgi:serine/threonine protein phosphatase PrpC